MYLIIGNSNPTVNVCGCRSKSALYPEGAISDVFSLDFTKVPENARQRRGFSRRRRRRRRRRRLQTLQQPSGVTKIPVKNLNPCEPIVFQIYHKNESVIDYNTTGVGSVAVSSQPGVGGSQRFPLPMKFRAASCQYYQFGKWKKRPNGCKSFEFTGQFTKCACM